MTGILTKAVMERHRHFALHYATNWRNAEAAWYPLWNNVFTKLLQESLMADIHFSFAPQYPLVQWGISRKASVHLKSRAENSMQESLEDFDATDDEAEDDETQPLNSDDQTYQPRGQQTLDIASTRKLRSFDPGSGTLAPPLFEATENTKAGSLTERGGTTTPPNPVVPESQHNPTPSSIRTRHARSGEDSYFLLDYGLIKIGEPQSKVRKYQLFGHSIQYCNGDLPLTLEIKQVPSRSAHGGKSSTFYHHTLSENFRLAYKDIHLKVPVAFRCHPLQQSIIGIGASGHWWSFTVIKRSDSEAVWSRGFLCGDDEHDEVLRKLFTAARTYPANPLQYENGWVGRFLKSQVRETYNEEDCMTQGINIESHTLM